MLRPDFSNIPFRKAIDEYTAGLSPQEKALLGVGIGTGIAYPTVAGTVDMFSGPENISNSNEYIENIGLTAALPAAAAAGLGYSVMKAARPGAYADRKIANFKVQKKSKNDVNDWVASERNLGAAEERYQEEMQKQGMGAYMQEYGLYEGAKRLKHDHAEAYTRRRNTAMAFGAGLGAVSGGASAAELMMDEYPETMSSSLSMQDRQELTDLLEANGAI